MQCINEESIGSHNCGITHVVTFEAARNDIPARVPVLNAGRSLELFTHEAAVECKDQPHPKFAAESSLEMGAEDGHAEVRHLHCYFVHQSNTQLFGRGLDVRCGRYVGSIEAFPSVDTVSNFVRPQHPYAVLT